MATKRKAKFPELKPYADFLLRTLAAELARAIDPKSDKQFCEITVRYTKKPSDNFTVCASTRGVGKAGRKARAR